jgi:hypothetical protein
VLQFYFARIISVRSTVPREKGRIRIWIRIRGSRSVPLTNRSRSRRPKTCGSGSPTLDKRIWNWTTQKDEKVREMDSFGTNKNKIKEAKLQN